MIFCSAAKSAHVLSLRLLFPSTHGQNHHVGFGVQIAHRSLSVPRADLCSEMDASAYVFAYGYVFSQGIGMLMIVAIGWIYVVLMMALTEHSFIAGLMTFLLYGVFPLSITLYLLGTRQRRERRAYREQQARLQAQAAAQAQAPSQPDHPPADKS